CDRPREPGCDCGSKEERESSCEKDEAPIARGDRIDGCNRLDREDRRMRDAELRACGGELRTAEPDPTVDDLTGSAVRAARDYLTVVNQHECRVLRQRRRLTKQSEHVVAERQRHRDPGEDMNAGGDRGGRSDSRA